MKHIKPGRGPSAMGALGSVIAVVFGIFWTVSVASMGAPISFSIFGVLFVIVGIVAESALWRPVPGGRGHVRTGEAPALLPLLRRQAGGFLYILRSLRQAAA